jgi:hypothetical protein
MAPGTVFSVPLFTFTGDEQDIRNRPDTKPGW